MFNCRLVLKNSFILSLLFIFPSFYHVYSQESGKTQEVIVEGIGITPEAAKKNGFRNAVSKVVGSFIENDTLIKNDKIIEEKLLEYSGGFVETFEIIGETKDKDGLFKMKLKAKVAQQTLVEKLRSMKIDVKNVSGSNLKAQLETQEIMKKDGKKMINSIMEEYPKLWQAKQIEEPKIANGKLSLQIEVSVDREKYNAWAEKLCTFLEKNANRYSSRTCKKSGPVESYNLNDGRSGENNWSLHSINACYYEIKPEYLKQINTLEEREGLVITAIRNLSPSGNCDLESYFLYQSNPLFENFGKVRADSMGPNVCFDYLKLYLPNKIEIKLFDNKDFVLAKETVVGPDQFGLWDYFNKFAMSGNLFPITPFPLTDGFSDTSGRTFNSMKCLIKINISIDGVDVGNISKITTNFKVEK